MEVMSLFMVAENPKKTPEKKAGGAADRKKKEEPTREAHESFSCARQRRTARAMRKRKSKMMARTKRRVNRTAGWV